MKQNFGFIVAVGFLACVLAGAILLHAPIERAIWPSRPAYLSNKIVQNLPTSEPSPSADSANADRLDSGDPLPAPHRTTASGDKIEEPIEPTTAPTENFGRPTGLAAAAGKEFAFDLYARLAATPDSAGKNLFFSPYSVSSVLIMAAEGARGETAEEMGKALHFPKSLHRAGPAATDHPWGLEALHRDMAAINQSLSGMPEPQRQKIREQIAPLWREAASIEQAIDQAAPGAKKNLYEKLYRVYGEINKLASQIALCDLNVANALWVDKSYPPQKPFLDMMSRYYQPGGAFPVDFRNEGDRSREQINVFVKRQTNGRITDLVSPGEIDPSTSLVLTAAIYFKCEWLQSFAKHETADAEFSTGRAKVNAQMMHQDRMTWGRYGAFNADGSSFNTPETIPESKASRADNISDPSLYPGKGGFLMLEMPYIDRGVSMVVLLPVDDQGLGHLETALTAARFDEWIAKIRSRDLHVFFPKFGFNTSYKLAPALQAMGMARAFSDPQKPAGAQFGGICASKDPSRQLYISDVLHNGLVEVNEQGTEAEAGVAMELDAPIGEAIPEPVVPFVPTFRADKPFIFAIPDTRTGTILFLGRVVDPRG